MTVDFDFGVIDLVFHVLHGEGGHGQRKMRHGWFFIMGTCSPRVETNQ